MENNIPKKIHYIWFGKGPKSDLINKCISSWEKYMPTYEIIEWNETNFQLDNQYAVEAYEVGKYAFVSDYARLKIIYEYGGIYLDTDVELLRSLEPLLEKRGFIGFERENTVTTGLGFAAQSKSPVILKMLESYKDIKFIYNGKFDNTPCPRRNTEALIQMGLLVNNSIQQIEDIMVYPSTYFCPMNYDSGQIVITKDTYTIHHYGYSWSDVKSKKTLEIKRKIFNAFPEFFARKIFWVVNKIFRILN